MELLNTLYYHTGEENKEFWDLLNTLKEKGTHHDAEWNGDYLVSSFNYNGYHYLYWENMEYGIPSSIEKYSVSTN